MENITIKSASYKVTRQPGKQEAGSRRQEILLTNPDNSATRDTRHATRQPGPPFQELTSGWKQPESVNYERSPESGHCVLAYISEFAPPEKLNLLSPDIFKICTDNFSKMFSQGFLTQDLLDHNRDPWYPQCMCPWWHVQYTLTQDLHHFWWCCSINGQRALMLTDGNNPHLHQQTFQYFICVSHYRASQVLEWIWRKEKKTPVWHFWQLQNGKFKIICETIQLLLKCVHALSLLKLKKVLWLTWRG